VSVDADPWEIFDIKRDTVKARKREAENQETVVILSSGANGNIHGGYTVGESHDDGSMKCGATWHFSVKYSAKAP